MRQYSENDSDRIEFSLEISTIQLSSKATFNDACNATTAIKWLRASGYSSYKDVGTVWLHHSTSTVFSNTDFHWEKWAT